MMHNPIILKNISLEFFHKICFQNFSTQIHYGQRIGIIGRNGNGKSTLLAIIQGLAQPSNGQVIIPKNTTFGFVPQLIDDTQALSGGQRFNQVLSKALAQHPNILCLDEPTNNLDAHNKQSLMRMLQHFNGTLIVVSHDAELLKTCVNEIWHLDEGKVTIFSGSYDTYLRKHETSLNQRLKKIDALKKEKIKARKALEFEKQRAAQRKNVYKYETDRLLKEAMRERGTRTTGKNQEKINKLKDTINQALQETYIPEIITPTFSIKATDLTSSHAIVSISGGNCGYAHPIIQEINLQISPQEHIAILGNNGSGKTTIIKALLQHPDVIKAGTWLTPKLHEIGYLDQHYATLKPQESVFDTIKKIKPNWTSAEIRKHLNDFLFRKNEEINCVTAKLSGGEKARLCLAQIAAQSPRLLILDEMTNNLDRETREHVIQVLQAYPGALIIISHDDNFLAQINIDTWYIIENGRFSFKNE